MENIVANTIYETGWVAITNCWNSRCLYTKSSYYMKAAVAEQAAEFALQHTLKINQRGRAFTYFHAESVHF